MCQLHPLKSLAAALLVLAAVAHARPVEQPYTVWIADGGGSVYSGPDDDYYVTQKLPPGSECEVYEELRDGWLAIRPPAGSYSLVLRSALELGEGDLARVARADTPSRVGSLLSDQFSSVHVRLREGETVQVIDDGTRDNTQWVTIAPPAGEFRWMRSTEVTRSPRPVPAQPIELDTRATTPAEPLDNDWQQRREETAAADASTASPEIVQVASQSEPSEPEPTIAPPLHEAAAPTAAVGPVAADSPFAKQLDQLEIALSRRVAGPVNLWLFDDLEQQAAQLLSTADTPDEQQAVRDVAARLSRFAAIGQRYRATPQSSQPAASTLAASSATSIQPNPANDLYDAVGVLRPVVSKQGNAPPYALVDENGSVVTFVTPSPSLNLQQYLGQRVGVSGTRGFLPEYRSRNIQTARVAPVESSLLR